MPKVTSPRKRGAVRNKQISTRQPSRCSKCDGRPLRSQCIHTVAGRIFLGSQPTVVNPRHCQRCPGKPLQTECPHTVKGRAFLDAQRIQAASQVISINGLEAAQRPLAGNPNTDESTSGTRTSEAEGSAARAHSHVGTFAMSTASPTIGLSSSPDNLQTDASSSTQSPSLETSISTSSSPAGGDSMTPCPLPPVAKRAHPYAKKKATMRNPIYGIVRGAKRGNDIYETYRTHQLPKPLRAESDVSRRFTRLMNRLLQRCEDVAVETGCWLVLGAQHVNARGGAFHYASPRLCREAGQSVEEIATLFNTAASQLMTARRSGAVMLQRQYDDMLKRKVAADKAIEEANNLLEEYQNTFGALPGNTACTK